MLLLVKLLVFLGVANNEGGAILVTLFLMFVSAKLMAEVFERLRQPAVAGEILADVIIGPSALSLGNAFHLSLGIAQGLVSHYHLWEFVRAHQSLMV